VPPRVTACHGTWGVDPTDLLPAMAVCFAVPQYIPQIQKLRRTGDTAGLSTARALLAGINNAYWCVYFVTSGYWFALINSASVTVLGG
jgi:PQ loop repeat